MAVRLGGDAGNDRTGYEAGNTIVAVIRAPAIAAPTTTPSGLVAAAPATMWATMAVWRGQRGIRIKHISCRDDGDYACNLP